MTDQLTQHYRVVKQALSSKGRIRVVTYDWLEDTLIGESWKRERPYSYSYIKKQERRAEKEKERIAEEGFGPHPSVTLHSITKSLTGFLRSDPEVPPRLSHRRRRDQAGYTTLPPCLPPHLLNPN